MEVQLADFVTIGVLVVLEGLLSADNALVLAVMILVLVALDVHAISQRLFDVLVEAGDFRPPGPLV